MNPFEGLTPEQIASAVIVGGICLFFISIMMVVAGKEKLLFGILFVVIVLGVFAASRG